MVVASCLGLAGCTTDNAELKREIAVLLQETREEIKSEAKRMDMDMQELRAEVVRLRSQVGQAEAKVGRVEARMSRLGTEVTLLQSDAEKSHASLTDLVVRVNQLDRHIGKADKPAPDIGTQVAPTVEESERSSHPPLVTAPSTSERAETAKSLQYGMSEQDVLRLFGNPHGIEKVLDSVYWYYGEGDLQGEYVRFDAKSGRVNGWSTFSPQPFQLDLRTTHEGRVQP